MVTVSASENIWISLIAFWKLNKLTKNKEIKELDLIVEGLFSANNLRFLLNPVA